MELTEDVKCSSCRRAIVSPSSGKQRFRREGDPPRPVLVALICECGAEYTPEEYLALGRKQEVLV